MNLPAKTAVAGHADSSEVEERRSPRIATQIEAFISCPDFWRPLPCTIVDVSREGCQVQVMLSVKLPSQFDLEVPSEQTKVRVRLIWRAVRAAGLAYAAEARQTPLTSRKVDRRSPASRHP